MWGWLLFVLLLVVIGLAWWRVFRGALTDPNNGNEFSRDDIIGGE